MRKRDLVLVASLALALTGVLAQPQLDPIRGLSIDTLFWLRYQVFGRLHDPADSPTVVVALDEETDWSPEFRDDPEVIWTLKLAPVLNALVSGGAKVIGYDIIWPKFLRRYVPAGNGDNEVKDDSDYLRTLQQLGARQGKIVLAKVQHTDENPISPTTAQSFAVGNEKNLRSVNLIQEPDDVVRRVPASFIAENKARGDHSTRTDPSMSVELAARALGVRPEILAGAGLALGDYVIPSSERNVFMPNFDYGNDIPTYPLVDLYKCAKGADGGADYFREHFSGKVVLVGYVRNVEDRKVMAKRFIAGDEHFAYMPRCATTASTQYELSNSLRIDKPGVYIHAAAVNSLLRREVLHEIDRRLQPIPVFLIALGLGLAGLYLGPIGGSGVLAAGALGWTAIATVAFRLGWSLPFLDVLLAAVLSAVLITAYRFAVADRDKRLLRANFSLYLAPEIVERMIDSARPPALGGEQRVVSIFFSDLKDFTTLSENMAPTELVAILNAYFSAMEDIVKAHGGLVDKYIGDAIVAVFGSTHADPDHARQAVETALACCRRLAEMNADGTSFLGRRLVMRIGLNTGEALVGNIGSKGKFNWTVMGDTVNVASRLQDLNKRYGTTILASEATVAAAGPAIAFRRVDRVQVKGRHEAVDVYTPEAAPLLDAPVDAPADSPVTAVTGAADPVARVTASPAPPA